MHFSEIHARDPFILAWDGSYYLVGTTRDVWGKAADGFDGFVSEDLLDWEPLGRVLAREASPTWAAYQFWAPELYARKGSFWLFYSGKTDDTRRGSGVAVADAPAGPFHNISDRPLTPLEWECLDGHLFADDDGSEYCIFVHEWVQCQIGEMWAQPIAPDYSQLVGEPHLLFKGGEAGWSNHVIDGPMMLKHDGLYHLFWSSFNDQDGYCCGVSIAESLYGPYIHSPRAIIGRDGGHNCVFTGFDGQLYTSFHRPNQWPQERVQIARLDCTGGAWKAVDL